MAAAGYRLEVLTFEQPTLRSVPTSYLITLEGSSRRDSYMRELRRHRPTETVVVVHNAGFRKCPKEGVRNASQDLWHANQYVARLARSREAYALVLEDDVRFTDHFRAQAAHIDAFLTPARMQRQLAYTLGSQGYLSFPCSAHHVRLFSAGFAHAVVYSPAALHTFDKVRLPPWALHDIRNLSWFEAYAPRDPCAVAPYERTENARRWDPLRVFDTFHACVAYDAERAYDIYHAVNRCGGVVAVALALAVAATAAHQVKLA